MNSSIRHPRALFLAALITLVLSVTSLIGLQSAQVLHARGRVLPFPPPIFGAESLRLGANAALEQYEEETLDALLDDLARRGVRWVRQEFRWSEIEPKRGQFDWSASDRIFSAAARHGINILPVLWTTPPWARAPSASAQFPPIETAPPADLNDFAQFVRAFAERYDAGRLSQASASSSDSQFASPIFAYQIWDEPNLSAAWGNALIDPTYYLQMLRAARRAIHEVNPNARIMLAGLAPTVEQSNVNLAPQTFLLKLYQLGGHEAFDIAAAKAYGFDFPPDDRRVDAGVLNFSHVILMREMMAAHNDGHKAIWLTPFGWNALPAGWSGEPSIWGNTSEAQQADYTRSAVRRAAMEWPWVGGMFVDGLQPRPRPLRPKADARWGFALLDAQGRPRPVYEALTQAVGDAAHAPRAQLFANCQSPQSLYRALNLDNVTTAMPEILASKPDCATPNPRAQFSEGWRFGQLGADVPDRPDAKVSFRFTGNALALIVRRGNYRAYTFVRVDGRPANRLPTEPRGAYLIMTSPGLYPVIEMIPVADGLGEGEHVAEITVDRGWNQWALIGWSSAPVGDWRLAIGEWFAAGIGVLSAIALIVLAPRARWGEWWAARMAHLRSHRPDTARWNARAVVAALILWLTAALTWAQDAATAYRNLGLGPNVVFTGFASGVLFWSPTMVVSLIALAALTMLVLLRLEAGLMLLAFFIPFYLLPQRLFERSFAMVELLTLISLASWGARWLRIGLRAKREGAPFAVTPPRLTLFDWSALALVGVGLLSALQADFRVEAFRELRLVIVEPALVYLMLRMLPPDRNEGLTPEQRAMPILDGFALGAVAVAMIGLINYAQGNTIEAEFGLPRIKSVFGSPNNDALYLERALPMMLAVALLGRPAGRTERGAFQISAIGASRVALYGVGSVPVALALLLTQSRGALLLGAPAAIAVMALLAGGRWRWIGVGVLIAVALAFAVLLSGAAQPLLTGTRFGNALDLQRGTGFFRLNLWQSALNMWRDHPLLGVGPDNFLYAYRSFYILPAAWQEPNLSHPHNLLLDFAARLGALGLIVGVGLTIGYGMLVKRTLPVNRPLAVGCAGLLAAMLAHGLVDHSFFLVELAHAFMLTAGVMATIAVQERPGRSG
ncbi:O-antigen ligase family protein [Candidatus Roseilinea sp. NK_OTU-006]|nr:O-antigen ligase family protein [Candidatus Roseilinea sp. NK_OTU-006]